MNKILENIDLNDKKILFLAETHFQFINCINIAAHSNNSKCDLFINKMYKDTDDFVGRIKKLNLFRNVSAYDESFSRVEKTLKFLRHKSYVRELFTIFDYDYVFFASRNFVTRCVVTYCKYNSPSTRIISYDEGLGTYISRMEKYTNRVEKLVVKMLYRDQANLITDKILYKPEAYIGDANKITLYRMPKFDEMIVELVNEVYKYNNSMDFCSNTIYFDNYYDGKDETKKSILECLIKNICEGFVIKKHPQTADSIYEFGNVYKFSHVPYEIIAANDKEIEKKILITIMSTAVWTPMLLFDKYPKIILLYPLINSDVVNDATRIIEKMISLYPEDRIVVIKNMDDLNCIKFHT